MRLLAAILCVFYFGNCVLSQDTITDRNVGELSLEELMQLTIYSASKKVERLNEAPAIASVLTKNDLLYYSGLTLIDVLKYVPDVEVSMGSEGFYRVSIRGTRKEGNILFMVDGNQLNDFYNGRALFDIPVAMIDRIEIIRGPGSALFGSNAVAGVINVFTIKTTNLIGTASTEAAMNFTGNYYVEKGSKNFAFTASYLQNTTPTAKIYQDKEFDQSWSETFDSTGYIANRWNKDVILSSKLNLKDFHMNVYAIHREQGAYIGPFYVAAADSKLSSTQIALNLLYNFNISDNVIITPKFYFNYNGHNFVNQETPDNYLSSQSGDLFADGKLSKEKYTGLTYGSQIDVLIKVNKHFDFLTGSIFEDHSIKDYSLERNYQIVSDENKQEFGTYDDITFDQNGKRRYVFAYFIQGKINFDKLDITTGVRYDDYSDFGQSINPRLGVSYEISKNLRLKGLVGRAFRAPTFLELYDNTSIGNATGVKGNNQLSPEIISTYEIGSEFARNKVVIRYNLFHIHNTNLIRIYDPHGGGSTGVYENIGDVKTYGHGIEGILRISQSLQFFVNFSHYISYFDWKKENVNLADIVFYSKQPNYNRELRNIPTMRINSGLKFNYGKWRVFIGGNFGNPSQNNKRFYLEKDNYVQIPYYIQGNGSISYEILPNLMVQFSATNIGKKYSDPEESTNIDAFGRLGLIQPGPMFSLHIKYDI